ncbi:hypothetical protein PIB30_061319 [Stylosanthes scabra]|uniref:Uncharacterized protein n=1 Tax=Stylosanthes scabra TaxID=79078 RepID=A0ABU6TKM4_9FABA|nr:hypothetical protein [Stylosanthes scabra]
MRVGRWLWRRGGGTGGGEVAPEVEGEEERVVGKEGEGKDDGEISWSIGNEVGPVTSALAVDEGREGGGVAMQQEYVRGKGVMVGTLGLEGRSSVLVEGVVSSLHVVMWASTLSRKVIRVLLLEECPLPWVARAHIGDEVTSAAAKDAAAPERSGSLGLPG